MISRRIPLRRCIRAACPCSPPTRVLGRPWCGFARTPGPRGGGRAGWAQRSSRSVDWFLSFSCPPGPRLGSPAYRSCRGWKEGSRTRVLCVTSAVLSVAGEWLRAPSHPSQALGLAQRLPASLSETLSPATGNCLVPAQTPLFCRPAYLRAFVQGRAGALNTGLCFWVLWTAGQYGSGANPGSGSVTCQIPQQQCRGAPDKIDYLGADQGLPESFCGGHW